MPPAGEQLLEDEEKRDSEIVAPNAEEVKIYLPSELLTRRRESCGKQLREKEALLRRGMLRDCIAKFTHEGAVGQRGTTRAATLVQRVQERIDWVAKEYKRSRDALVALVEEEVEEDTGARRRLGLVGSQTRERRISKAAGKKSKEKGKKKKHNKEMSWIWTSGGGPGEEEWSKAKARRDCWAEEVELLREEIRRVLRFLAWRAGWWEERVLANREVREDVRAGMRAYAARQASMVRQIGRRFRSAWDTSASEPVRVAVEEDRASEDFVELALELS
ncbi:hypothetical protein R3P38DRAFT_2757704 [Favolaschia claudopus]|uniref:Uncharacterized protein n=1 Tax=Favolaschia claudopus TaxID=2862362 RepID=A0AAW0EBL0_9AGAR